MDWNGLLDEGGGSLGVSVGVTAGTAVTSVSPFYT